MEYLAEIYSDKLYGSHFNCVLFGETSPGCTFGYMLCRERGDLRPSLVGKVRFRASDPLEQIVKRYAEKYDAKIVTDKKFGIYESSHCAKYEVHLEGTEAFVIQTVLQEFGGKNDD